MNLDAGRLRAALVGVFEGRRQHPLPNTLSRPPIAWTVPYRKMAKEVGISPELLDGYQEAATFLDPILSGSTKGQWDPKRARWR